MAIVGRRMRAWKRQRRELVAGHGWQMICWFDVEHHDLHATKGWRLARRFKSKASLAEWDKAPAYQEHFVPAGDADPLRLKLGPGDPGRLMRGRTPTACAVRVSCHDWWRRQQFGSSRRMSREEFRDALKGKPLSIEPGTAGRSIIGGGQEVVVAPTL